MTKQQALDAAEKAMAQASQAFTASNTPDTLSEFIQACNKFSVAAMHWQAEKDAEIVHLYD